MNKWARLSIGSPSLITYADDAMICVTLRKLLINSIQPKCDGDNDEMDFKCVLHRSLFYHFVSLFRVESQRSSRHVIPADYRSLLSYAATRNFHFTSQSRLERCGGGTHLVDANLSKLPSVTHRRVLSPSARCFKLLSNHLEKQSGCWLTSYYRDTLWLHNRKPSGIWKELSISSFPAILSLFVRLYCSDSFC